MANDPTDDAATLPGSTSAAVAPAVPAVSAPLAGAAAANITLPPADYNESGRAEPGFRPGQDRGPIRTVARCDRIGPGDSGGPLAAGAGGEAGGGRARQAGSHPPLVAR
jgi:hypothetical protein